MFVSYTVALHFYEIRFPTNRTCLHLSDGKTLMFSNGGPFSWRQADVQFTYGEGGAVERVMVGWVYRSTVDVRQLLYDLRL
jgi:hypothetical protein